MKNLFKNDKLNIKGMKEYSSILDRKLIEAKLKHLDLENNIMSLKRK